MRKSRIDCRFTLEAGPRILFLDNLMDAERINAIGNSLNDLAKRVEELRGYL